MAVLLLGQLGAANAEKADHDKPINFESDKMSLDNAKHVSIFEGKVELNQGTLRVLADKIIVTEDTSGHKFCVASGYLASFRQKRDEADEYVEGYGERIEYDTLSEQIDFYGRARVKREQDDVRGDHITYSTKTEVFRVNSPEKTGRVRATLQPKNKESNKTESKPAASNKNTAPANEVAPKAAGNKLAEPVATDPTAIPKQPGN